MAKIFGSALLQRIRVGGHYYLSHSRLLLESAGAMGYVLAPALFCIATDWILASMGITVGSSRFTDQDYADDAVLFTDCPSKWPPILSSFDEAAHTMGLSTSWLKTKTQNLGHRAIPASV